MFNYSIKVHVLPQSYGKLIGFASLIIDETMQVDGWRIIDGVNGLFATPPQHQGKGKDEEGNEVTRWYDDVRFLGENAENIKEEIKKNIIEEFSKQRNTGSKQVTAQAQQEANKSSSLW